MSIISLSVAMLLARNSSGISILSFWINNSTVDASVIRPGTSSLEATHTFASSSQKASTSMSFLNIMSPLNYVFYQDCVALLSAPFRFLFLVLLAYSAICCVQNLYVESRGGSATIQET